MRGHRDRQAHATTDDRADAGVDPAQSRMRHYGGVRIHPTAECDADPQRGAAVPPSRESLGARGDRRERGVLVAGRGGNFDGADDATTQVGRDDAGGDGTDVDADRQVTLVVDLDGYARPADRARLGQVGALAQQTCREQGRYLTIDGGDARPGDLRDHVTRDRTTIGGDTEDRRPGAVGDTQVGGNDPDLARHARGSRPDHCRTRGSADTGGGGTRGRGRPGGKGNGRRKSGNRHGADPWLLIRT